MPRPRLVACLLSVSCLLAACAHDAPLPAADALPPGAENVPEAGRFVLTGIPQPVVATVTETGIQGPAVNLGRFQKGTEWRGTVYNQTVNLQITAAGAEGVVGRNPFTVRVRPVPDGMEVTGIIGGLPSTVSISKSRINGAFGPCGYDLTFQGKAYLGPRACSSERGPIQVGLTLPPILASWPDAEVATVLGLLLSR